MQTNERVKKLVKAILQSPHQLKWEVERVTKAALEKWFQ